MSKPNGPDSADTKPPLAAFHPHRIKFHRYRNEIQARPQAHYDRGFLITALENCINRKPSEHNDKPKSIFIEELTNDNFMLYQMRKGAHVKEAYETPKKEQSSLYERMASGQIGNTPKSYCSTVVLSRFKTEPSPEKQKQPQQKIPSQKRKQKIQLSLKEKPKSMAPVRELGRKTLSHQKLKPERQ